MKEHFWRPLTKKTWLADGRLVELKTFTYQADGSLRPSEVRTLAVGWPARTSIPPSTERMHGRDLLYDQHVAGKPLMVPLLMARTFVRQQFGE